MRINENRRSEKVVLLLSVKERMELEKRAQKLKMPVSPYLRYVLFGGDENDEKKNN